MAFGDRGIDFIGEYMCFIIFYYTAKQILVRSSKKIITIVKQVIFETWKRKIFGKMWRMWRFPKFSLTISLNMCMICSFCRKFYIWNIFLFPRGFDRFRKILWKEAHFAIIEIFFRCNHIQKISRYVVFARKIPLPCNQGASGTNISYSSRDVSSERFTPNSTLLVSLKRKNGK